MAKASKVPALTAHPKVTDQLITRLPWPTDPSDLGASPRRFRIQRLDSYAWQAYITDEFGEFPIGKPDIFDIIMSKIKGIMRHEGQTEYLSRLSSVDKKLPVSND